MASLKVNQRHCPHCNKTVSYKTYQNHKRLYYSTESDAWILAVDLPSGKPVVLMDSANEAAADMESEPASSPDSASLVHLLDSPPCSNPALSSIASDSSDDSSSEPPGQ